MTLSNFKESEPNEYYNRSSEFSLIFVSTYVIFAITHYVLNFILSNYLEDILLAVEIASQRHKSFITDNHFKTR